MKIKKITWKDYSDADDGEHAYSVGSIGGKDVVSIERAYGSDYSIMPFDEGELGSAKTLTAAKLEARQIIEQYILSLIEPEDTNNG